MIGKSCDFGDFFLCHVSSKQTGKKYIVRKKNCHSHARNYIESWNSIVYHVCQSVRPSLYAAHMAFQILEIVVEIGTFRPFHFGWQYLDEEKFAY